jgi:hypothetical protein
MRTTIFFSFLLIAFSGYSNDSIGSNSLHFEAYADFFINATINNQRSHKISEILYNYNRSNEFAINLAYLKSSFSDSNFRMNLAFMTGTYAEDNLANENPIFKNIMEANVGYKLSKSKNEWIDIGIFGSHIGYETPIGYDCSNLSRSLLAENSPFYEMGIKYTHITKNEKWTKSLLLLNGWQRITMESAHSIPALGMQFIYKPSKNSLFNYSNFLGSTRPDSLWALRTYHNFYWIQDISNKLRFFANVDIGSDKNSSDQYSLWYGGILSLSYQLKNNYSISYRMDFLEDPNDVLYSEIRQNWLVYANSINVDRTLNKYSKLRFEIKYVHSSDQLLLQDQYNYLGAFLALQIKI